MARQTLDRSVKYKRLIRTLGIPRPHVRGYLETFWDVAHECGVPSFATAEDVEAAAEWDGEPGVFFRALLSGGWIDSADNGFQIHDYWDHAPEYVRKRRMRELLRQKTGAALRKAADNGGQVSTDVDERQTTADNGKHLGQNGKTRTPAPSPSPLGTTAHENDEPVIGQFADLMALLYPRFGDGGSLGHRALFEMRSTLPSIGDFETALRAWAESPDWNDEGGKFVPRPEKWIRSEGWKSKPRRRAAPPLAEEVPVELGFEEARLEVLSVAQESGASPEERDHVLAVMSTKPDPGSARAYGLLWFGGYAPEREEWRRSHA